MPSRKRVASSEAATRRVLPRRGANTRARDSSVEGAPQVVLSQRSVPVLAADGTFLGPADTHYAAGVAECLPFITQVANLILGYAFDDDESQGQDHLLVAPPMTTAQTRMQIRMSYADNAAAAPPPLSVNLGRLLPVAGERMLSLPIIIGEHLSAAEQVIPVFAEVSRVSNDLSGRVHGRTHLLQMHVPPGPGISSVQERQARAAKETRSLCDKHALMARRQPILARSSDSPPD